MKDRTEEDDILRKEESNEVPLSDRIKNEKEAITESFYIGLLKAADQERERLQKEVKNLLDMQLELRDEVALHCFIHLLETFTEYRETAEEAYRAADAFMRMREHGNERQPIITH